jgi:hypothetical protein
MESFLSLGTPQTFVFFHIGSDISMPTMLVETIRLTNADTEIIQCSDAHSPAVHGVSRVDRGEYDPKHLMIGRLKAFAQLALTSPALYLDTDMLVVRPIDVSALLNQHRVSFCHRSFNFYGPFIGTQRGLDFSEYAGKPLGEVYPYVACATSTIDHTVWGELVQTLERLDPKFKIWYGDQEAMKVWASENSGAFSTHPEEVFGCLPEEKTHLKLARVLHFKGVHRKPLMEKVYAALKRGRI